MRPYDLAIFDCDGVLFDSMEANRIYYNSILARFGRQPMSEENLAYVHMHTAQESIDYLFRDDGVVRDNVFTYAMTLDYSDFLEFMTMEPGVEETIESIRPPIMTAISTNRSSTMPKLRKVFGLDDWFDEIVCALDVQRPKPDPEGVFKILRALKTGQERAIYIGDSIVDEMVAVSAGIPLIAYKNPDLNALFHVKHFSEIRDIVLG
jgi:phosphoglycolate phosphatase